MTGVGKMNIDAERAAFEAECEKLGLTIYAGSDCGYAPEIQCAWMLWQARAAMPLVITEGYALVPIEPDGRQQFRAAFNLCSEFGDVFVRANEKFAMAVYREMVAAAPVVEQ